MYDLQTNYPNVAYRDKQGKPAGATIASGGCCPTSVGNILRNLCGITEATTKAVCALATECGARYNGGTTPSTLLDAANAKWGGFTYEYTASDAEMKNHVAAGGMALAHTPGSNGGATALFSTGGHFVAIVGMVGATAVVVDPYFYTGKWTANSVRRANVTTTNATGKVNVVYDAVAVACDCYCLISKKPKTVTTTSGVVARKKGSVTSDKLGTLNKGITLQTVSERDGWIESYGYIPKKSCTLSNSTAETTSACNIRADNSKASVLLGTAVKGAKFTVIDQTDNWVKVRFYVAKARVK